MRNVAYMWFVGYLTQGKKKYTATSLYSFLDNGNKYNIHKLISEEDGRKKLKEYLDNGGEGEPCMTKKQLTEFMKQATPITATTNYNDDTINNI